MRLSVAQSETSRELGFVDVDCGCRKQNVQLLPEPCLVVIDEFRVDIDGNLPRKASGHGSAMKNFVTAIRPSNDSASGASKRT